MRLISIVSTACLLGLYTSSLAWAADVDALEARVNTDDADRFVAIFEATGGAPKPDQIQTGYIEPGTEGLKVFTPGRIEDGQNLSRAIAGNPEEYRRAIDVCLPIAKETSGELRAVYLALEGLLGDPDLPRIYALFGAGNSGGTAGPGVQVIGLEVICREAKNEHEIRALLRSFYAHETVHTLQPPEDGMVANADPLLSAVLREGVADFVATIVTGRLPSPERAAWAKVRERELWNEFSKDRKAMRKLPAEAQYAKGSPVYRWIANVGSPPAGWPGELGYWLGMEIASAYVDAAADKRAAVAELVGFTDPEPILEKGGYAARFE